MRTYNHSDRSTLRKHSFRPQRKLILILCCGTTETLYFQKFRRDLRGKAQITIDCVPKDPTTMLKHILKIKNLRTYDEKWVVIDKDDFENIQNLITQALKHNIHIVYSNPCIELWVLLHFEYLETSIPKMEYITRIEKHIRLEHKLTKYKYDKADSNLYDYLLKYRDTAIKNAKKLLSFWKTQSGLNADSNDPSTNIISLIESIL